MKIAILTLPLHTNYGGILQAYTLQCVMQRMGHEVIIINLPVAKVSKVEKVKEFAKRLVKRFLLFKSVPLRAWPTDRERKNIAQHIAPFIHKYLQVVECTCEKQLLNLVKKEKVKALIVGSDQVWRPGYSTSVSTYFLDFLKREEDIKKISYAASFGLNYWAFTKKQTQALGELIRKFDAVSVREDSAVTLCRTYWGINASWLLDPTLLLDKTDYMKVCDLIPAGKEKHLMVYILDSNINKDRIIQEISELKNLPVHKVMAKNKYWNVGSSGIKDCIVPPISEWIEGFMNAVFVVTDSFHGMAFSIIFEKPFICIGNKTRGMARFTSLLKLLELEDRLIHSVDDLKPDVVNCDIDYSRVNVLREKEINKSIQFLQGALCKME